MLAEELYFALLDVSAAARRDKIPGPARALQGVAHRTLELFWRDERAAGRFAALVLKGDAASLRRATGSLPDQSRRACWRLIGLLEYLAEIYGEQISQHLLQP